jgi:hypothetical protein
LGRGVLGFEAKEDLENSNAGERENAVLPRIARAVAITFALYPFRYSERISVSRIAMASISERGIAPAGTASLRVGQRHDFIEQRRVLGAAEEA